MQQLTHWTSDNTNLAVSSSRGNMVLYWLLTTNIRLAIHCGILGHSLGHSQITTTYVCRVVSATQRQVTVQCNMFLATQPCSHHLRQPTSTAASVTAIYDECFHISPYSGPYFLYDIFYDNMHSNTIWTSEPMNYWLDFARPISHWGQKSYLSLWST